MVSLGEIAKHYAYEYVCVKVCVLYLDICMKIDLSLSVPPPSIYIYIFGWKGNTCKCIKFLIVIVHDVYFEFSSFLPVLLHKFLEIRTKEQS